MKMESIYMRTSVTRTADTATRSHREMPALAVFNDDNTTTSTTSVFLNCILKPSFHSVCRAIERCVTPGKRFTISLLIILLISHTLQTKLIFLSMATTTTALAMT